MNYLKGTKAHWRNGATAQKQIKEDKRQKSKDKRQEKNERSRDIKEKKNKTVLLREISVQLMVLKNHDT